MKQPDTSSGRYLALAGLSLVLLVLNVLVVKTVVIYGSPFLFATALLIELILFGILIHSLIYSLRRQILGGLSIGRSGIEGMLSNPILKRQRDTPVVRWLARRLDYRQPLGLPVTVLVGVAALFLVGFLNLLGSLTAHGAVTQVDQRVINLVPSIRTPLQNQFFIFWTFLASGLSITFMSVFAGILFWVKRQRLAASLFILVPLVTSGIGVVLKLAVHRPRPDTSLRLVKAASFSFPSGHALIATVFFGLVTYFLYRTARSSLTKLLLVISYIVAVFSVGVSRVYLAVHYPSDVIGGILLGGIILTAVVGALEILTRFKLRGQSERTVINRQLYLVPLVAILIGVVVAPVFERSTPSLTTRGYVTIPEVNESTIRQLPLYSETLTGARMEPISFVYSGSEDKIVQLFESHGWFQADRSTVANTLRAMAVAFQGGQYATAPVTPSYLNARPNDLAFQRPTDSNNLRQRHHTRLWLTGFSLPDGSPIWAATASLDEGVEFAGPAKLPTHRINPNIDAERAYIIGSLNVPDNLIGVVDSQLGKNASGDAFYTDGKAELVRL